MKTNLATFPKFENYLWTSAFLRALWTWKENFTKELQQYLEWLKTSGASNMQAERILEEILGQ